ncbi:MAG TPA: TonB-dependent receptor [Caulobacteraceae bacterium]|jgi:outer membrane receptor protein involved in Fe transport|nr:TonB-dependent receptor [Caulobacteraceae bacterium]
MRKPLTSLGVLMALSAWGQAEAQSAPAAPPAQPAPPQPAAAPPATTVQGVTVTSEQGGFKSAIDRKSYDLTKDIQAQAGGTIGDALNGLPGVSVDVQGNISIRGDANVQILVDGKPSGLFTGPGRAQVLQTLPADQYERAEVLTNPSTQYSPNGSAGIINLISKKTRKPTRSGSLRVMDGSSQHWRLGGAANYVAGPLSFNINAGLANNRIDGGKSTTSEGFDAAGTPTFKSIDADQVTDVQRFRFGTAGVDYDLDAKTRVSAGLQYFGGEEGGNGPSPIRVFDGAGAPTLIEDRAEHISFPLSDLTGSLSLRRTFDGDQHDLTLSASAERMTLSAPDYYTDVGILPALPQSFEAVLYDSVSLKNSVKADYERPMPRGGQWKAGYELDDERDQQSHSGFINAPTPNGPLDPAQNNRFHFNQTIQALYTTYQQPFGKATVLAGLRYETTSLDIDQETQHLTRSRTDGRLYASLHLSYQIGDAQSVTASYSQRIERPQPQDYDPFRAVLGPLAQSQGNPDLRPQQTADYELGYQYKRGQTYYLATLYYKDNREGVTPVEQDLGNGVILTTQENLASSRSGGLELAASGKLVKTVTYNVSADAAWNQIDATPLGFAQRRTGESLSGRGTISWQATPNDVIQANGFLNGKQLTAQGYNQPGGAMFLGYRHKFDPHLSLFVTALDVFNTLSYRQVFDTATLHQEQILQFRQRALLVGLTYSFGGAVKQDPQFDFGTH